LLPPSLREWLPENHLVYFVSDARLMIRLLVYGYCTGVFSSRRIQKRLREDIPFKVLAAGNEPDFRTISDFRKIHIGALE